jgi:hypothetical protein
MAKIIEDAALKFMTPEEQKIARDLLAAEEAGQDALGDGTTPEPAAAAAEGEATDPPATDANAEGDEPAGDAATVEAGDQPADGGDGQAAAATEGEGDKPNADALEELLHGDAPFVPKLDGKGPENYDQQRKDLREQKSAARATKHKTVSDARKKWSDGLIEDEAFDAAERAAEDAYEAVADEVDEKLQGLLIQRTKAEALKEAGQQIAQQSEQGYLSKLAARAKKDGTLDYSDAKVAGQFDRTLTVIEADPEWAAKSFEERADEAHRVVMALNGKVAAAPAPAAAAPAAAPAAQKPAARTTPPAPPVTLRDLPAAAVANAAGTVKEQWQALSGVAAERFFASLSPAKQAELLGEAA